MPNLRQTEERKIYIPSREQKKPRKINLPRFIAFSIIVVCVLVSSSLLIYKNISDSKKNSDVMGAVDTHTPVPTPVPTPTPTPKPTSSPIDAAKLSEDYPADITKALVVNNAAAEKKVAYLTFDDGPSKNTTLILEALEKYNAKATFFVTGDAASKKPELVLREYEEGHSVANHSFTHDYGKIYATADSFKDEILKTEEAIGNIIGKENVLQLFRFPGGSYGEKRKPYKKIIEETGYKYVDWNALNSDADGKAFSAERCMSEIKKYCTDTGDVVILMHDTGAKTITAETLPRVLEYLISQGYAFERIVP